MPRQQKKSTLDEIIERLEAYADDPNNEDGLESLLAILDGEGTQINVCDVLMMGLPEGEPESEPEAEAEPAPRGRGRGKQAEADEPEDEPAPRGRGRGRAAPVEDEPEDEPAPRGRGRGRAAPAEEEAPRRRRR